LLPCTQSTQESRRIVVTFCFEFEHRPGARMFVRSSTVGRD
jgi:hypothetical protein